MTQVEVNNNKDRDCKRRSKSKRRNGDGKRSKTVRFVDGDVTVRVPSPKHAHAKHRRSSSSSRHSRAHHRRSSSSGGSSSSEPREPLSLGDAVRHSILAKLQDESDEDEDEDDEALARPCALLFTQSDPPPRHATPLSPRSDCVRTLATVEELANQWRELRRRVDASRPSSKSLEHHQHQHRRRQHSHHHSLPQQGGDGGSTLRMLLARKRCSERLLRVGSEEAASGLSQIRSSMAGMRDQGC